MSGAPKDSAPNAATFDAAVKCNLIEPDPKNRDKIDKERVKALAATIAEVGLLQPIVLRAIEGGRYRIIAGEHRWRAHLELKRPTIAATIFASESELDAAKKKAVENAMRVDLTPIERAKRFRELAELGESQKNIGELFGGLSQPVVANALRLLELPASVQKLLAEGKLSEAHGVSLVRFAPWSRACEIIAHRAVKDGYSSKTLNSERIPFRWDLIQRGLVIEINTGSHYSGPIYELPADFKKDPGCVDAGHATYYFLPDDEKENKWPAIKANLDQERTEKEAAAAKQQKAKVAKGGKPTKEALERKKVIAENKQARTEASLARGAVLQHLSKTKDIDPAALTIVVAKAFVSHWRIGRFATPAATGLSIPLPKGFAPDSLSWLSKLKPVDLLRVCAGAIALDACEQGIKQSYGVQELEEVSLLLGAKKTEALRKEAAGVLVGVARANAVKTKGRK